MSDINIDIGFIGPDVIALCNDDQNSYAFHAHLDKSGSYKASMSSTQGLVTTSTFKGDMGIYQMVMISMSNHMDSIEAIESRKEEKQSSMRLN